MYVSEDIDGTTPATGDLTLSVTYRYYVKLNLVDANRNIVSSATLGGDDLYVEIFESAAIDIKVMGLPAYTELDYDRIEVEVYRTKADTPAPMYLVRRELVDYSYDAGYITFTDSKPDISLGVSDLDPTITSTTGGELGNQWRNPPKAKTVTTAGNRLILGKVI